MAAYLRKVEPITQHMELEALVRSRDRTIKSSWRALEILELEKQLQALDLEDARDEVSRLSALFEAGFISQEELLVGEIDESIAELDEVKTKHDYIKQQLNILQYYRTNQEGDT